MSFTTCQDMPLTPILGGGASEAPLPPLRLFECSSIDVYVRITEVGVFPNFSLHMGWYTFWGKKCATGAAPGALLWGMSDIFLPASALNFLMT